jgi:hypothetical protein
MSSHESAKSKQALKSRAGIKLGDGENVLVSASFDDSYSIRPSETECIDRLFGVEIALLFKESK